MTKRLSLEEALRKLARSRRIVAKQDHGNGAKVQPARSDDVNAEFGEAPTADTALCIVFLAALALIDFFALKWL